MLANKKGTGLALGIIMAVLLIILMAYVLFPIVRGTTSTQPYSESLVRVSEGFLETVTLAKTTEVEDGTLAVTGLTVTANYTVNYTTGAVVFINHTINGTYPSYYKYYEPGYLTSSSHRALMGVVVLAGIIGLLYFLFAMTGVIGPGKG